MRATGLVYDPLSVVCFPIVCVMKFRKYTIYDVCIGMNGCEDGTPVCICSCIVLSGRASCLIIWTAAVDGGVVWPKVNNKAKL